MKTFALCLALATAACSSSDTTETSSLACSASIDELCRGIVPCYRMLDQISSIPACREMTVTSCAGYEIVKQTYVEDYALRYYRDGELVAVTGTSSSGGLPSGDRSCAAGPSTFAEPICELSDQILCD